MMMSRKINKINYDDIRVMMVTVMVMVVMRLNVMVMRLKTCILGRKVW